ncbi:MAG: AAA family ATPase [Bryobacterales bacterium]|nr:AAA family ATPase [Bryobacterales bacterium]
MAKKRLPIGIQTFRKIREGNFYYVDKTPFIKQLVDRGTHYFLSRPRRFGKSLFLDTMKELFEGNESLFQGLSIHPHWDWSIRRPVVRLSFGAGQFGRDGEIEAKLSEQLGTVERQFGVVTKYLTVSGRFASLLRAIHRETGQSVVILVDEYDKPILDTLEQPQIALANRDFLRDIYSVIKDCDTHVQFVFLTGVSKFSNANLFSGLNNLNDITLDRDYSAICGYTESDLCQVFGQELVEFDHTEVREWYHGYRWSSGEAVYTPFDILFLIYRRQFGDWWCETGNPRFLVDTLLRLNVSSLELDNMVATREVLSEFDVDEIAIEALLFQTGYLTIRSEFDLAGQPVYHLGYPNREVRSSLNRTLLHSMIRNTPQQLENSLKLVQLMRENDFPEMEALVRAFYSSIPYERLPKDDIANNEQFYATVFYSYLTASGFNVIVEERSTRGRADMTVRFNRNVYIFEFKVVEIAGKSAAMAQLKLKKYAEKYRHLGQHIRLIGVEFSRDHRDIVAFQVESG